MSEPSRVVSGSSGGGVGGMFRSGMSILGRPILQSAREEDAAADAADAGEEKLGVAGTIGLVAIQTIVFVFDFVTYPFYLAAQRPWRRRSAAARTRATLVERSADGTEVTFEPAAKMCPKLQMFIDAGIDTMDKCWSFTVELNSHKRMLGTRAVLREEDEEQPDGKVFKKWEMGEYQWKTYAQIDEASSYFGRGLRGLGLEPRRRIAIFAETKAEWLTAAIGCFKQTFTLVTLYANLGVDAVVYGVNQTEVTHIITTHELLPKFKQVLQKTPKVQVVIYIEDQLHATDASGFREDVRIISFKETLAIGSDTHVQPVKPTSDDPAIVMFTSGSTGTPKGVVLTNEALITTIKAYHFVVNPPLPDDIYLGYLPLAHILELLAEMTMLVQGIPIGYSSPNTMTDTSTKVKKGTKGDCAVLRPTLMCAVPLVIDRIYKGIQENIRKQGLFKRKLMDFCYEYKSRYRQLGFTTPLLNAFIFNRMRMIVGGRIRLLLSGGAPLSPQTHDYVRCALDLPLVQGYGLTETCACATIMDADEQSTGRVGPPLQGIKIKLINWDEGGYNVTDQPFPRGEICIGGGNVATGYFRLPEKTAEDFFTDPSGCRWFKTGDIGQVETDGTLRITDRKKDLVKLQFGEYVSLGKVEAQLKTCPLVDNVCVYGDSSKSYCVALVVPNRSKLEELAASKTDSSNAAGAAAAANAKSFEELCRDPSLNRAMLKEITSHGLRNGLQKFELPGAITIIKEMWDPDSGLVTAAFKLKRKPIQERYKRELSRMYGGARSA